MIYAVDRLHEVFFLFRSNRATGVAIAIEAREIAAGDFQADAMARKKDIRGRSQVDVQFIDVARLHEDG